MKLEVLSTRARDVILLSEGSTADVMALEDAIRSLSTSKNLEVTINRLPFITLVGDCVLTAKADGGSRGLWKVGPCDYDWILPKSEWEWIAKLIEPLQKPWKGGHQYLHEGDQLMIVISSREGW